MLFSYCEILDSTKKYESVAYAMWDDEIVNVLIENQHMKNERKTREIYESIEISW